MTCGVAKEIPYLLRFQDKTSFELFNLNGQIQGGEGFTNVEKSELAAGNICYLGDQASAMRDLVNSLHEPSLQTPVAPCENSENQPAN